MNRKSSILLVLFAGVMSAGAIWLITSDSVELGQKDEVPAGRSGLAEAPPNEEASEASSEPTPIDTLPFDEDDPPSGASQDPEARERRHVVLVFDQGGNPAAGADIFVLPLDRVDRNTWLSNQSPSSVIQKLRADDAGRAIFHGIPKRGCRIRARTVEALGFARFDPLSEPQETEPLPEGISVIVRLEPIKVVRVKVSDQYGAPVPFLSVRATAATEVVPSRSSMRGSFQRDLGSTTTEAPDGTCAIEITAEDRELYDADRIIVAASPRGLPSVSHEMAIADAGTTLVHLVIPPTVGVRVRIVDAEGELVQAKMGLAWFLEISSGRNGGRSGPFPQERNAFGRTEVRGGEIVLGGFAPGVRARFTTSSEEHLNETTTVELPATGSDHVIDVRAGSTPPSLKFRLLDSTRAPLADLELDARLQFQDDGEPGRAQNLPPGGVRPLRDLKTDGDGNVSLRLDRLLATGLMIFPKGGGTDLSFTRRPRQGGGRDPVILAEIPLPDHQAGSVLDLGDVVLPAEACLVTGTVVDVKGRPQSNVPVQIDVKTPGQERAHGRMSSPTVRTIKVETNRHGGFTVYGLADQKSLCTARSEARNRTAEPVNFQPGARDLKLVIMPTGGLSGRVRYVDGLSRSEITLRARRTRRFDGEPSQEGELADAFANPDKEGKFVLRGLPAGTYSLLVQLNRQDARLLEGLLVAPGETASPSAIQDLLIGQDFMVAMITVLSRDGGPIVGAKLQASVSNRDAIQRERRDGARTMTTDSQGKAEFVLARGAALEILARADGYTPKPETLTAFPAVIILAPDVRVIVSFPAPLPPKAGVTRYRFRLVESKGAQPTPSPSAEGRPIGSPRRERQPEVSVKPGSSEAKIDHAWPGTFRLLVDWEFERRRDSAPVGSSTNNGAGQAPFDLGEVQVPPLAVGRPLNLAIDARVFSELLAK